MSRTLIFVSLLALDVASPLAAQRNAEPFEQWQQSTLFGPAEQNKVDRVSLDEPSARRDYRYEGLLIGGVPFGTFGFILGHGLTRDCPTVPGADCRSGGLGDAVTLGLLGAAVGGGLGYLIGRLSPKPPPRTAADSTAF
jgi:hypothetical protein